MDHQARRLCHIGTDCSPASRRAPRRGAGVIGGGPPGSAGVPPACTPVLSRSVSLRCPTPSSCRWKRHGLGRSRAVAGPARNLVGATPAIRGRFLVKRSEPSFAGFVSILPGRMRARRPRSRVGPARDVIAAGNLSSTVNPLQGAPSLPLQGSYSLCQVQCGRDARAPGWASFRDGVVAKDVQRSLCLFVVRLQQPSAVSS